MHDQIEDGTHLLISGDILCCLQHFVESLEVLYPKICRLSAEDGVRHPVIRWQVALSAGYIFLAWVDLSQAGHAYSADE